LTLESNTDGNEAVDESMDSPVIKALRKQVADLTKLVNNAPTRESIEAEVRGELARQSAISEQLIALGHPAGLSEFLNGKLGDADISRESVVSALQSIGFQVEASDAPAGEGHEPSESTSDLAKVTGLSAQVRSAAQGVAPVTDIQRINQAQSQEELTAIMAELGLAQ
jgi:hypothetical protein